MGNITIRTVTGQEMLDILYRLDSYAFRPTPPLPDRKEWEERIKNRRGASYSAVFENGEGVAIVAYSYFTQNIRGKIYQMGGFFDISTHPKTRRKGYVRELMRNIYQELNENGCAVSALYPFRGSFYERLGYVTFPQSRKALFQASDLLPLLKTNIEGDFELSYIGEAYEIYHEFVLQMQKNVHGMSVFEDKQKEIAAENRSWLLQAKVEGEVIGILGYTIKGDEMMNYTLQAPRFYYKNAHGKYLLLEWIARHVDQAGNAEIWLPAYEQPNTWFADINPKLEPVFVAPMGRVLNISKIIGTRIGPGGFRATISDPDCPWNNGTWKFTEQNGELVIIPSEIADCNLTIQGLSALIYGVTDPGDFVFRGWGDPSPAIINTMRAMFPAQLPYLHEYY
jgi:predicted acetyltransferase